MLRMSASAVFISGPGWQQCGPLQTSHSSGVLLSADFHSYLQKSLSPLGKWSPSMASRCTTLLWITRRHRVCRDSTVERRPSEAIWIGGGSLRLRSRF